MQQRRFRPGDVLDDYCPRERRITDHAVVAMIDDRIKQTRCVVCDAEHEYKEGKVPPQRRKRPQSALFAQVLDGLQAPQRVARRADFGEPDDVPGVEPAPPVSPSIPSPPLVTGNGRHAEHTPVVLLHYSDLSCAYQPVRLFLYRCSGPVSNLGWSKCREGRRRHPVGLRVGRGGTRRARSRVTAGLEFSRRARGTRRRLALGHVPGVRSHLR